MRRLLAIMNGTTRRWKSEVHARVLRGWRDGVKHQQQLLGTVENIERRLRSTTMLNAFDGWLCGLKEHRRVSSTVERLLCTTKKPAKRLQKGVLLAVWYAWSRAQQCRSGIARMFIRRSKRRKLSCALNAWFEGVRKQLWISGMINREIVLLRTRATAKLLVAWRNRVLEQQVMMAVMKRSNRQIEFKLQKVTLREWQHRATMNRRILVRTGKFFNHTRKKALTGLCDRWRCRVMQKQRLSLVVERAVQQLSTAALIAAWSGWWHAAREKGWVTRLVTRTITRTKFSGLLWAWDGWLAKAREQKRISLKTANLLGRFKSKALARAVYCWQTVVKSLRGKNEAALHQEQAWMIASILKRLKNRDLEWVWDRWVEGLMQQNNLICRHLKRLKSKTLFSAWVNWFEGARLQQQHFCKSKRLVKCFGKKVLARMMKQWLDRATEQWQVARTIRRGIQQHKTKVLKVMWNGWHYGATQQRLLAGTIEKILQNLKCRMLSRTIASWGERAICQQHMSDKVAIVMKWLRYNMLIGVFENWIYGAREKRRLAGVMDRVLRRLKSRTLVGAWGGWQDGVKKQRRQKGTMNRAAWRLQNKSLARAWSGWLGSTIEQRRTTGNISDIVPQFKCRVLAGVWTQWHCEARRQLRLKNKMRLAIQRLKYKVLFGAWSEWRDTSREHRRLMGIIAGGVLHLQSRLILVMWREWRDGAMHQRRLTGTTAKAVKRLKCSILKHSWTSWHRRTIYLQQVAGKMEEVLKRLKYRAIVCVWGFWICRAQEKRRLAGVMDRVLRRLKSRTLVGAWGGWQDGVRKQRWQKGTMNRAAWRLQNKSLARAWSGWLIRESEQRRRNAQTEVKLVYRLHNKFLAGSWDKWRDRTEKNQFLKVLIQRFLQCNKSKALKRSWVRWVRASSEQRKLKNSLKHALKVQKNMALIKVLNEWHDGLKEQRRLESKLDRAIQQLMKSALASGWTQWLNCAQEQLRRRRKINTVVQRFKYRTSVKAWNGWQLAANKIRRKKRIAVKAVLRWNTVELRSVLIRWFNHTIGFRSPNCAGEVERAAALRVHRKVSRARFLGWRLVALDMRRYRRHVDSCLHRQTLRAVVASFNAMFSAAACSRRAYHAVLVLARRHRASALFTSMCGWNRHTKQMTDLPLQVTRNTGALHSTSGSNCKGVLLCQLLHAWNGVWHHQRRLYHRKIFFQARVARRVAASCAHVWCNWTARRRIAASCETSAVHVRQLRVAEASMTVWKMATTISQKWKFTLYSMGKNMATVIICHWRRATRRNIIAGHVAASATSLVPPGPFTVSVGGSSWRQHCAAQQAPRCVADRVYALQHVRREAALAKAFAAWAEPASYGALQCRSAAAVGARARRSARYITLSVALHSWSTVASTHRRMLRTAKLVGKRVCKASAAAACSAWALRTARNRWLRRKVTALNASTCRQSSLAAVKIVVTWHSCAVITGMSNREILANCLRRQQQLHFFWWSWLARKQAARISAVNTLVQTSSVREVKHLLRKWAARSTSSLCRRQALVAALRRSMRRKVAGLMKKWRSGCAACKRRAHANYVADKRCIRLSLRVACKCWRRKAWVYSTSRTYAMRIVRQRAITAWAWTAGRMARFAARAERAAGRAQARRMAIAFHSIAIFRRHSQSDRATEMRHTHSTMRAVTRRWLSIAATSAGRRRERVNLGWQVAERRSTAALRAWRNITHADRSERMRGAAAERLLGRWCSRLAGSSGGSCGLFNSSPNESGEGPDSASVGSPLIRSFTLSNSDLELTPVVAGPTAETSLLPLATPAAARAVLNAWKRVSGLWRRRWKAIDALERRAGWRAIGAVIWAWRGFACGLRPLQRAHAAIVGGMARRQWARTARSRALRCWAWAVAASSAATSPIGNKGMPHSREGETRQGGGSCNVKVGRREVGPFWRPVPLGHWLAPLGGDAADTMSGNTLSIAAANTNYRGLPTGPGRGPD
jgi:hypothetical protein